MPPPSIDPSLHLIVLPKPLRVFQLSKNASLPSHLLKLLVEPGAATFVSITRTDEELSIVTDAELDESEFAIVPTGYTTLWRALKVQGPMDLSLKGIMHALTAPLKTAGIPIFALSTWNTDYLLITNDNLSAAVKALQDDGWVFA